MLTETSFRDTVVEMIRRAETTLPRDVLSALRRALNREREPLARFHLKMMLENLSLARKLQAPICQDTGTFTFFVKLGLKRGLRFDLGKAMTEAVKIATREVPLRANAVDPLTRRPSPSNTGRDQPAVHIEITPGKDLELELLVKGAGTENCSRLFMMRPTAGVAAIEEVVLKAIEEAGGKSCPPNIVGVGIGGSMETATLRAKQALLRPLNVKNPDPELAKLEHRLESSANKLNIGPMGLGGKTTVLGVRIEKAACHTASLPVAVAFQCWPARRSKAKLVNGKLRVVEP
ncbi:MAG: fumarate hydratase [Candidatus Hadarchaeum sp.]|uniref:fumarate hydratase n=1 Tax=Candidatus Hadarchaeum sp. TaxID=2883567 RepID=UPI003D13D7B7